MKQEDVAALAGLFNSTAETVNQAVEDGKVSELITAFSNQNKVFSTADFDKFQDNLKKQALTELDKNNLPQPVYEYVKGSVLEKAEKDLAKAYGLERKPLKELVEDIISTKTKTNPDDEVQRLKARIVEVENDYNTKLTTERSAFKQQFVNAELERIIGDLPIDAEGEKLTNQRDIVRTMLSQKIAFDYENGILTATREGKLVTDSKLDPVPVKDVIYEFAKNYVNLSPAKGGRGDSSSTSGSRTINFAEYCEKNGIMPNSMEFVGKKRELESKGYKLE